MAGTSSQVQNYFNNELFQSSCSTIFNKTEFEYTWSIHDFRNYCNLKNTKIESSTFSDGTINGLKWRLVINENGWNHNILDRKYYLTLGVILISEDFDEVATICQISILSKKLEQLNKVEDAVIFNKDNICKNYNTYIEKTALLNRQKNYLHHDTSNKLIILCKIIMLGSSENISRQFLMPKDLGLLLFENPDNTMITFSVGGRELLALKVILVASSPVFAAMFNHDTEESKSNRIEITNIDYEVLHEMLRFIYTNKISNLDGVADRLLIVADKYALETLKHKCEESMSRCLSFTNALNYYVLANQHNADGLKMLAKNFIMSNARNLVQHDQANKNVIWRNRPLFEGLGLVAKF